MKAFIIAICVLLAISTIFALEDQTAAKKTEKRGAFGFGYYGGHYHGGFQGYPYSYAYSHGYGHPHYGHGYYPHGGYGHNHYY